MIQVAFYDTAEDSVFDFAVIIAKKDGKWLLCRHKERTTWEFPGGHREKGERIEDAARRELFEETGAKDYTLQPICAYSCMKQGGDASFGMLYYADVKELGALPAIEIRETRLFDEFPDRKDFWTYSDIQPFLLRKVRELDIK